MKNRSVLFTVFFILVTACNQFNTSEKILQSDKFIINAEVIVDSLKIINSDTSYQLHGDYSFREKDSKNFFKAKFYIGILHGETSLYDIYNGEYSGKFIAEDFDKYYQNYSKASFSIIKSFIPIPSIKKSIKKPFYGVLGVPDGKHIIKQDDIITHSSFFKKGRPTGTWQRRTTFSNEIDYFEFKKGIIIKEYSENETLQTSETDYEFGLKKKRKEYNKHGNNVLIEKYNPSGEIILKTIIGYNDEGEKLSEVKTNYLTEEHSSIYYEGGEVVRKVEGDREYYYENSKLIGTVVNVKFNNRDEGISLKVPEGKIWTPLYYENSYCYFYYSPLIYPKKNERGWLEKYRYKFPEKKQFSSIKESLRNNKAISGNGKQAVFVNPCQCPELDYTLYFYEETK